VSPVDEAVLGAVFGIGGAMVAVASRYWPRPRTDHTPVPASVVTVTYRYCPAEQRTRAAIQHTDGTAQCTGCHTHIPTLEAPRA
jgi:hypothetical protein